MDQKATNDPETKQLLSDGEEVSSMLESRGWRIVRAKLDERILDLQNINNIDVSDIKSIPEQIAARKMASDLVFAWLKDDVVGFAEQQKANADAMKEEKDEGFIGR